MKMNLDVFYFHRTDRYFFLIFSGGGVAEGQSTRFFLLSQNGRALNMNRYSPDEHGFEKLYDYHETQRDQYESQIEQQHQAAHALGVWAKRIGRRHGLDGDARLARDLGLDRGHFGRGETVAAVRVVAGRRSSAPVAPARVM